MTANSEERALRVGVKKDALLLAGGQEQHFVEGIS